MMEKERDFKENDSDYIAILLVSCDGTQFSEEFYKSHKIDFSKDKKFTITDCRDIDSEDIFLHDLLYYCLEFTEDIEEDSSKLFFSFLHMIRISQSMESEADRQLTRPNLTGVLASDPNMNRWYCNYLKRLPNQSGGVYVHNYFTGTDVAYIDASKMIIS